MYLTTVQVWLLGGLVIVLSAMVFYMLVELNRRLQYIEILEQGVDELHARCKDLEHEMDFEVQTLDDQEFKIAVNEYYRFDEPQIHGSVIHIGPGQVVQFLADLKCERPVPTCPTCGSDSRAGKCFVDTGSGLVLCISTWHSSN